MSLHQRMLMNTCRWLNIIFFYAKRHEIWISCFDNTLKYRHNNEFW